MITRTIENYIITIIDDNNKKVIYLKKPLTFSIEEGEGEGEGGGYNAIFEELGIYVFGENIEDAIESAKDELFFMYEYDDYYNLILSEYVASMDTTVNKMKDIVAAAKAYRKAEGYLNDYVPSQRDEKKLCDLSDALDLAIEAYDTFISIK